MGLEGMETKTPTGSARRPGVSDLHDAAQVAHRCLLCSLQPHLRGPKLHGKCSGIHNISNGVVGGGNRNTLRRSASPNKIAHRLCATCGGVLLRAAQLFPPNPIWGSLQPHLATPLPAHPPNPIWRPPCPPLPSTPSAVHSCFGFNGGTGTSTMGL
jgi:hypothetical protein